MLLLICIPRLRSRGPIEADSMGARPRWRPDIPRLRSRGPIEASRSLAESSRGLSTFRGCEAAAPLKHRGRRDEHQHIHPFRGCEAAAPLKPGDSRGVDQYRSCLLYTSDAADE